MAFIKYQKSESVRVVDAEEESNIKRVLAKIGKSSVRELTEEERKLLK